MDTDSNSCMIQRDVDLTEANTLRLASSAAAKVTIKSIDDLHIAFQFHRKEKLPLLPLGDGSNVILSSFINACILDIAIKGIEVCLLYTSPSPRDVEESRMPSSA